MPSLIRRAAFVHHAVFTVFILLPLALVLVLSQVSEAKEREREETRFVLDAVEAVLTGTFLPVADAGRDIGVAIVASDLSTSVGTARVQAILDASVEFSAIVTRINLLDARGTVLLTSPADEEIEGTDRSGARAFRFARGATGSVWGAPEYIPEGDYLATRVVVPVGRMYLEIAVVVPETRSPLRVVENIADIEVGVVAANGLFVLHTDQSRVEERQYEQFFPQIQAVGVGALFETETFVDGDRTFLAGRKVPGLEWAVVVYRTEAQVGLEMRRQVIRVIGFIAVILVAGVITTFLVFRWVRNLLDPILDTLREYAEGNYAHRIDSARYIETALIAESVHAMARRLKEREVDLKTARRVAETANDAKDLLLANVSHEIRTPLNAIIGINRTLSRPLPEGMRTAEDLLRLQSLASGNLERIVDDLLDYAAADRGHLTINPSPVDVNTLLCDIADLHRVQVEDAGLRFVVDINIPPETVVRTDAIRLAQVLGNLLTNAAKFTERGSVALRGSVADDLSSDGTVALRIDVEDTGPGIPEHVRHDIFVEFVQGDLSPSKAKPGIGLGLSIARSLTKLLGGSLEVLHTGPQGTVFSVALVVERAEVAVLESPADDVVEELSGVPGDTTILVVEDEAINRLYIEGLLRQHGYGVVAVADAESAEKAARDGPDCILMDVGLPRKDGYHVTRALKADEHTRSIPVVALTAHAFQRERDRAREVGMVGFVSKPIREHQLLRTLEEALRGEASL